MLLLLVVVVLVLAGTTEAMVEAAAHGLGRHLYREMNMSSKGTEQQDCSPGKPGGGGGTGLAMSAGRNLRNLLRVDVDDTEVNSARPAERPCHFWPPRWIRISVSGPDKKT